MIKPPQCPIYGELKPFGLAEGFYTDKFLQALVIKKIAGDPILIGSFESISFLSIFETRDGNRLQVNDPFVPIRSRFFFTRSPQFKIEGSS